MGEYSILVLLDLSAAFDTVAHRIMMERLRQGGVSGSALTWFSSYLSDRNCSVSLGPYTSDTAALTCGVPQGSALGLFSLYMLPLGHLVIFPTTVTLMILNSTVCLLSLIIQSFSVLHNCLNAIKDWMSHNFLQLNIDKTEVRPSLTFFVLKNILRMLHSLF